MQSETFLMPGDSVNLSLEDDEQLVLGPGLRWEGSQVVSCVPGLLKQVSEHTWLVQTYSKKYVATKGDHVLGVVTSRAGDLFRVDIGCADFAAVSFLAFEGATKRNRPDVKVGDVLYARLSQAGRHCEPELTCVDGQGRAQGMGVLRGGLLVHCSLDHSLRLLSSECKVLSELGRQLRIELTVGVNGRVWLKGESLADTAAAANCITSSERKSDTQIASLCARLQSRR